MRRLHALTALALAVLAGPAAAAEISRVATSGEPGNPFDLDLSFRWDRSSERATITRERSDVLSPLPGGAIADRDRLRYQRTRDAIVPRIAIGLWKDLELHAELPYVLGDDREWRYGMWLGTSSDLSPGGNSITSNGIDANGDACAGTCPIFQVGTTPNAGYHGGRAGDLKVGLSWAIFNELKDDTKPFWLVGMDLTAPTSARWEPGRNRTADTWESEFRVKTKPGPFGERIWKWDLYTVLSKRYKYVDPYVKAHAQFAFKSASTYSNCDAARDALAAAVQQMNDQAVANCASWGSEADAKLPFVAGLTFGTELIPYEDVAEAQKVALDFRFFSELTSKHRFYNELTDATGKLHQTEGYMEVGGLVGLYLRASRYVQLRAQASLSTRTAHYLTGESLGRGDGWPTPAEVTADPTLVNPNFDWRYDAPGRRFRISEVTLFEMSFGAVLQF